MSAPEDPAKLWTQGAPMEAVQTAALVSIAQSLQKIAEYMTPQQRVYDPVTDTQWPGSDEPAGYWTCKDCNQPRRADTIGQDGICERCRITTLMCGANPIIPQREKNAGETSEKEVSDG